jgi:hypothetical protein
VYCFFPNPRYRDGDLHLLWDTNGLRLSERGITKVDLPHGSSEVFGETTTLALECRSCAIAHWAVGHSTRSVDRFVAEDIDEDVVMISGPNLDGLMVVPRRHIGELEELSVRGRGHILAAVRRAAQMVQERTSGSATRVVAMTGPPPSDGHVCFHVVPSA